MNILNIIGGMGLSSKVPGGDIFYNTVIPECSEIYSGTPSWQSVKRSGLYKKGSRKLNTLNCAKVLCDELVNLTFTENTEVIISDETYQKFIDDVLSNNRFYENIPKWLSYAYATGGGVLKAYELGGKILIDYISAENFYPTKYSASSISDGIFCSTHIKSGYYYTLVEEYGVGFVKHKLYRSSSKGYLGNEVSLSELYEKLSPEIIFDNVNVPLFSYFKPANTNNLCYDTPLGLSVFANCTDTLKALDTAFDSLCREFILGKKRIIVPSSCIRTVVDPETGTVQRYFDADDEVYQAMKCDDDKNLQISDNTMSLRITEHVDGINALLNILCFQTGLSSGTLSFDESGMKTATEVISENSKTFRTAKANKNMLSETLINFVHSLISLGVYAEIIPEISDYEVTISFTDNIIEDDNTIIDNNIKLASAGLRSKLSAIMAINKCDEETAKKELLRINSEFSAEGEAFDPTAI